MTQKFVARLLSADGDLLAWAEVYAEPRPQERGASCPFFPVAPTSFQIEQDGIASEITVHWCDLDVARRQSLIQTVKVSTGQVFTFAWLEPVWLVPGMRNVPLPAVTIRQSIEVAPPVGSLMGVV